MTASIDARLRIPRLQSTIYRLDYLWYTWRAWLTPKSPYVKQRSFLNGTDAYCIDVALPDNNWLLQWVPDSLFPFPPGLNCHHQSQVPVAVFCGSGYTIKPKENLREGGDQVTGAHCSQIEKVQPRLLSQRSSLTGCSITRLPMGWTHPRKGGESYKGHPCPEHNPDSKQERGLFFLNLTMRTPTPRIC